MPPAPSSGLARVFLRVLSSTTILPSVLSRGADRSASSLLLAAAKSAYKAASLSGSDEKDIVDACQAKVAGAEIDSSPQNLDRGLCTVGAPREKRLALSLSLEVARLPATTDSLHQCLLGGWTRTRPKSSRSPDLSLRSLLCSPSLLPSRSLTSRQLLGLRSTRLMLPIPRAALSRPPVLSRLREPCGGLTGGKAATPGYLQRRRLFLPGATFTTRMSLAGLLPCPRLLGLWLSTGTS